MLKAKAKAKVTKFIVNTEEYPRFTLVKRYPDPRPPKIIPNSSVIKRVDSDFPLFSLDATSLAQANKLGALKP